MKILNYPVLGEFPGLPGMIQALIEECVKDINSLGDPAETLGRTSDDDYRRGFKESLQGSFDEMKASATLRLEETVIDEELGLIISIQCTCCMNVIQLGFVTASDR